MLDTELYAVLSTAHIRPRTFDTLGTTGLVYDDGEARTRVRIPQACDPTSELDIPDDMAAAFAFVREHEPHAYGIMFDRDGNTYEGLPTYDWDMQ